MGLHPKAVFNHQFSTTVDYRIMDIIETVKSLNLDLLLQKIITTIEAVNPDLLLYGGTGFLLLVMVWYFTGRLFLIGWLVKILWLPINLFCLVLWVFTSFVNSILSLLRINLFFITSVNCGLLVACYIAYRDNAAYFMPLAIGTAVFLYLIKFGLDEGLVKSWIFYSPKARRTPKPKTDHRKLTQTDQNAEDLPRPTVRFLAKPQAKFETEAQIIEQLDEHLRRLMFPPADLLTDSPIIEELEQT